MDLCYLVGAFVKKNNSTVIRHISRLLDNANEI